MSSFEPVSLLRLYKIAHSDRRLSPARTDVPAHVAKMWAARNITGSNALLSGERNRVKPAVPGNGPLANPERLFAFICRRS